MIDIEKYKNVLDQGLLLDHYSLLCSIRDGTELPKSKRITGFINLLHKKGFLKEGALTESGTLLISTGKCMTDDVIPYVTKAVEKTVGLLKTPVPTTDFIDWASALHKKMQDTLKEKTGKIQARLVVEGTSYSFLPNPRDLSKVLLRAIVTYKLNDFDKIEKCLMNFLNRKIKEGKWSPLLGYYIMKNGLSPMVTDMENMENADEEKPDENDMAVNI